MPTQILILSHKPDSPSTAALAKACPWPVVLANPWLDWNYFVGLESFHILPRLGDFELERTLTQLLTIEKARADLKWLNSPSAIALCRDKISCQKKMETAKIPSLSIFPIGLHPSSITHLSLPNGFRFPVLLKHRHSSQGRNIFLLKSQIDFARIQMNASAPLNEFFFQEFIEDADASDYRFLFAGHNFLGCIKRKAKTNDFRANLSAGGNAEAFSPPQSWVELAHRAHIESGLSLSGIDFIYSKSRGLFFLEVNSSPGFIGFAKAHSLPERALAEKIWSSLSEMTFRR